MSNSGCGTECIYAPLGGPGQCVNKTQLKKIPTQLHSISFHSLSPLTLLLLLRQRFASCFSKAHAEPHDWFTILSISLHFMFSLSFSFPPLSLHYYLFHYRHLCICGLQPASGSLNYFWPCWASHRIRRGAGEIDVSKQPACCLLHPTFPSDKERPPTGIPACCGPPRRPAV